MKNKSILIFGAGKIGRSFIGQVFGLSGYEVIFSDVNLETVNLLNERKSYPVVIKGEQEKILEIPNVRAVSGLDKQQLIREISEAGILAVSVGKNAFEKVIPVIAEGLIMRHKEHPTLPMDIIIAENMRSASDFIRAKLQETLPGDYPLDSMVGLVETSIGKMVPIMTHDDLKKDPLVVFAEPYNNLIVDKKAFRGEIPNLKDLSPKENIKAWVDRKLFIHNLGHAVTAYFGSFNHPEATYIYEVLDDPQVYGLAKDAMLQSANILQAVYPNDFSMEDLTLHIEDLLSRFRNKALKDTIFRVGQDLFRKLGPDDRFLGIIRLAEKMQLPYDKILKAMTYAFYFDAKDEDGNRFANDIIFEDCLSKGMEFTLNEEISNIDLEGQGQLTSQVSKKITFTRTLCPS